MPAAKSILDGVHPMLVGHCGKLIAAMSALGYAVKVVQGVRTAEYQAGLYAQGRTAPGKIVTNADGFKNKSNHQVKDDSFGHAVDFAFVDQNGNVSWESHYPWAALGTCAEALGNVWGGRFKLVDLGHIELPMHVSA